MDSKGRLSKYTARFVAVGFSQAPGLDSHETYAPTAGLGALQTMLACGVQQGVKLRQLDINTAYLNEPPTNQQIYLEQSEEFKCVTGYLVCKLKWSL